jgi:diguanylate cyclase (GGDEF)-like protein
VSDPVTLGSTAAAVLLAAVALVAVRSAVRDRRRLHAGLADADATVAAVRAECDDLAARLEHLARHDPLTGLPNRALFADRLRMAARPDATAAPVTVLLVDLDGFRQVNELHGQQVGDELLVAAAERISGCLRGDDVVARLGGDEFAVLLRCAVGQAHDVADRVVEQLARPFVFPDCTVRVVASVGLVPAPDHRWEPDVLLQHAAAALAETRRRR